MPLSVRQNRPPRGPTQKLPERHEQDPSEDGAKDGAMGGVRLNAGPSGRPPVPPINLEHDFLLALIEPSLQTKRSPRHIAMPALRPLQGRFSACKRIGIRQAAVDKTASSAIVVIRKFSCNKEHAFKTLRTKESIMANLMKRLARSLDRENLCKRGRETKYPQTAFGSCRRRRPFPNPNQLYIP